MDETNVIEMNHLAHQHNELDKSELEGLLQSHQINPTQQRMEIAGVLFSKHQHISADQVLHIVNQSQKHVSKATVYNTLGLFAQCGLLREVIVDPNKVFYDTNASHHHHFFNISTGQLEDIPGDEILIEQLPTLPAGTSIDSVEVIVKISKK